ncbi:MAG: MraY family glycosyltransferase [Thermodesulfovibrionales bacterium]
MGLSQYFSYFAAALILSSILVPLMRPLSFMTGAVDKGTGRRVHTGIVPRLGGIGFYISFFVTTVFSLYRGVWEGFHDVFAGIMLGSIVIVLIGLYDDIRGARVSHKLIAEMAAALIIYAWGIRIEAITNPFGGRIMLGWMSLPVTVIWMIVITNAINLMDGLDGLAAGSAIFIAATFFYISGGEVRLQLALIILIGALCGFLIYNFPPASIFMGDAGSLFIGFFLGATSIMSSHKATALTAVMVPILAFSMPLMDMAYAVLRRYYRGVPLGLADKEHIHHKLLEKGLSKKMVLIVIYGINIFVMLIALLLISQRVKSAFAGVVFLVIFAVLGLRLLGYIEFVPIAREMKRNFELNRKRKYYNFIIKRFRNEATKAHSIEELKTHIRHLMELYSFTTARIYFYSHDPVEPFFEYCNENVLEDGRALALSVPIIGEGGCYGCIDITKEMDGEGFLCSTELLNALSDVMHAFARTKVSANTSASKTKVPLPSS